VSSPPISHPSFVLTPRVRRYEFRPNEFISIVKSVSLATRSKASGRKEFIAVGTTVYRAEDLAGRGGVSFPPISDS
jgi:hypothetical protein